MKYTLLTFLLVSLTISLSAQSVGISADGSAPDNSAMLDVHSTTKGMLVPRMTTLQRQALIAPADGLLVYDLDSSTFWYFNNTDWIDLSSKLLADDDRDTKIEVERTIDSDLIHFTVGGDIIAILNQKTLNIEAPGKGTFIGQNAGQFDDGSENANSAFGHFALRYNTSGSANTAIGRSALIANTTGSQNTGVGEFSLFKNTIGSINTAIGRGALNENTTGDHNLAVGTSTLLLNTSGTHNVALGNYALRSNTTGKLNTALGHAALQNVSNNLSELVAVGDSALFYNGGPSSIDGRYNTAVGARALRSNTTGRGSVAIGYKSSYANETGIFNTAIGESSLANNISGSSNVAVGFSALLNSDSGENVAVGSNAMGKLTSGAKNVGIGRNADRSNQTGSFNTIIGYQAGGTAINHSKTGNVFVGYQAGYFETSDNKLYIDNSDSAAPLIYGDFDSNILRVNGELQVSDAYRFPLLDGIVNQVLSTDGSGVLSWSDYSASQWVDDAPNNISYSGNVAIGTVSPTHRLHVFSNFDAAKISSTSVSSGDLTGLEVSAGNVFNATASDKITGIKVSVGTSAAEEVALIAEANSTADYAAKFDGKVEFNNSNSLDHEVGLYPSGANGTTSLFMAEDATGSRGVEMEYHGIDDKMYIKGRFSGVDYGPHLSIERISGDVVIGPGTKATGYKLSVDGKLACEEVLVELSGDWPDYVFENEYPLLPLSKVKEHIDQHGHLPNMNSAEEVEKNGVKLGEMQRKLMEKIEELTLYIIDLDEKNAGLAKKVEDLEKLIQN